MVRRPISVTESFEREPDIGVVSVNYDFAELLVRAGALSEIVRFVTDILARRLSGGGGNSSEA